MLTRLSDLEHAQSPDWIFARADWQGTLSEERMYNAPILKVKKENFAWNGPDCRHLVEARGPMFPRGHIRNSIPRIRSSCFTIMACGR